MTASTPIWTSSPPRLLASRHRANGALRFPPFPAGSPLAAAHETVRIGTSGRVYSYTVMHPNPKTGAAPYALGYVDLDDEVRLFGRIAGDVAIGSECQAVPDADYGYAFLVTPTR